MKFRSLVSIAFLACASLAIGAYRITADYAVGAFIAASGWLKSFVSHGLTLVSPKPQDHERPVIKRVQAKDFVRRMAKRERPELTGSWRMCPST